MISIFDVASDQCFRWPTLSNKHQSPQATEASSDLFRAVLDYIRHAERRMQGRLKQVESDMQWGQEEAVESVAKKGGHDKPITFRRKVYGEQFDYNERVAGCLEKAADEITKLPTNATSLAKAALDCSKTNGQITGTLRINHSVILLLVLNCSISCLKFCLLHRIVECTHYRG